MTHQMMKSLTWTQKMTLPRRARRGKQQTKAKLRYACPTAATCQSCRQHLMVTTLANMRLTMLFLPAGTKRQGSSCSACQCGFSSRCSSSNQQSFRWWHRSCQVQSVQAISAQGLRSSQGTSIRKSSTRKHSSRAPRSSQEAISEAERVPTRLRNGSSTERQGSSSNC